jgi:hypothetical protein
MPEDTKEINSSEDLIDVGEEEGAEINLDEQNNSEKEVAQEEKVEVEEVETKPVEEKKQEDKDELAKYSEGVQKRIAKLTRKMREAERQREEAIAFAELTKKQKEDAENRLSKLDKTYVSEFENRVKTNLAAAKLALKSAIESQNIDAQVAAQEQIANLTMDAARLSSMKTTQSQPVQEDKQVNINPQRYNTNVVTDPKAEDWASKNTWFGNDSAMTYTAFDIHKKLVDEEGYDPKSDEYYEEVDKRIRLEFPHKFDKIESNTTERAKPAQNVASAKRSASTGRKRTVKLTPSQVAIAKRLGVPLEDYAKQVQLKITEGV